MVLYRLQHLPNRRLPCLCMLSPWSPSLMLYCTVHSVACRDSLTNTVTVTLYTCTIHSGISGNARWRHHHERDGPLPHSGTVAIPVRYVSSQRCHVRVLTVMVHRACLVIFDAAAHPLALVLLQPGHAWFSGICEYIRYLPCPCKVASSLSRETGFSAWHKYLSFYWCSRGLCQEHHSCWKCVMVHNVRNQLYCQFTKDQWILTRFSMRYYCTLLKYNLLFLGMMCLTMA